MIEKTLDSIHKSQDYLEEAKILQEFISHDLGCMEEAKDFSPCRQEQIKKLALAQYMLGKKLKEITGITDALVDRLYNLKDA